MNCYMGEDAAGPYSHGYIQFRSMADLNAIGTSMAFVFTDERFDSINDGSLRVDMDGYDPLSPEQHTFRDLPGSYHAGQATFSFADNHAQIKRWLESKTKPSSFDGVPITGPNRDLDWLQDHATRKRNGGTR